MEEKCKKFHELYWLGLKPLTKKEIIEAFKKDNISLSDQDWTELYNRTKPQREETKSLRARWLTKFPHDNGITFGEFLAQLAALQKKVLLLWNH